MASNDQLRASIAAAAEKLGEDVPDTTEQTNAHLAETLKGLNTRIAEAAAEEDSAVAAQLAREQAAEAKAGAPEPELPEFYVPAGKAITTKRGILADNEEITAADLPGGREALNAFVKSGHVAKG